MNYVLIISCRNICWESCLPFLPELKWISCPSEELCSALVLCPLKEWLLSFSHPSYLRAYREATTVLFAPVTFKSSCPFSVPPQAPTHIRRSFATHAIDSSTWPEWLEVPAEVALPRSVKVLAPGSWSVPALLLHSKCLRICLMIPPGPWPLGLLHLSSRSLLRTPNQSHHRPRHNQTCAISSPLFPAARSPKPTSYSPVTPLHADASLIPQDSQPPLPDPPAVPPLFLFLLLPSPTSLDPRAHHCNHPLHTPPCFCCSSHVLPLSLNLQPSAHNLIFLCFLLKYDWHPMLP